MCIKRFDAIFDAFIFLMLNLAGVPLLEGTFDPPVGATRQPGATNMEALTGFTNMDATVQVIQLEEGKTDIINQYIMFCRVFDEQIKLYGYTEETIRETLRICRNKGILAEYIKKRENEIMDIMETLFDQEYVTRMYGLEERKAGMKEGEKERNVEFIRNLLQMNMDLDFIEKATGLSREDILKVKNGGE